MTSTLGFSSRAYSRAVWARVAAIRCPRRDGRESVCQGGVPEGRLSLVVVEFEPRGFSVLFEFETALGDFAGANVPPTQANGGLE
jgi:hypothetical protein